MKINTVIGIPAHGSHTVGSMQAYNGKKEPIMMDKARLRKLSDQLSELVEELDDIREDLNEMLQDIENNLDMADYTDGEADTPYDRLGNICDTVDGAYQELNEALDEMEELI